MNRKRPRRMQRIPQIARSQRRPIKQKSCKIRSLLNRDGFWILVAIPQPEPIEYSSLCDLNSKISTIVISVPVGHRDVFLFHELMVKKTNACGVLFDQHNTLAKTKHGLDVEARSPYMGQSTHFLYFKIKSTSHRSSA